MVEVGGQPLIWHFMKHDEAFASSDLYVALSYKGEIVKSYFLDFNALSGSISVSLRDGKLSPLEPSMSIGTLA